ncbi:MAG: hypothetical protein Q4A79_00940 [Candidatus Saccharibacteria bacterium]|nr:hypothetical protein [Candidatus Saccharibacteria bacterium]
MFGKRENDQNRIWVYDDEIDDAVELADPDTDELVKYLKIGDVLTYTGHSMMVYDLIYDNGGNVVDAKIMESGHGLGGYNVITKMPSNTKIGTSISLGSSNPHFLYLNSRLNTTFDDGLLEGSLHLSTFKTVNVWKNITSSTKERYSVLRFLTQDDDKVILTYHGANFSENDYDGAEFALPARTLNRLKFGNLYIEKTADVFNESMVEAGDTITYQIKIQNNSSSDYSDDIHMTEVLSPYVDYASYESSKAVIFTQDSSNSQLLYNIGKLASGEEIIINYTVTVKNGFKNQVIESTGKVEDIPSSVIRNKITTNLTAEEENLIEVAFSELKSVYNGKQLIDEIYNKAFNVDLNLKNFNMEDLVKNTSKTSTSSETASLNKNHNLYGAVLNNYYGSLREKKYTYNGENIYAFDMKLWGSYDDLGRRADTIYQEHFKTGDVLIYTNHDDTTYSYDSETDTVNKRAVTYESGEYAYIYIDGIGFVGVNIGDDGISGTEDDRNRFNRGYYDENSLYVYSNREETNEDLLTFANLQTLFGKDNYIILRPASLLSLNSGDEPITPTGDEDLTDEQGLSGADDHVLVPNTGNLAQAQNGSGMINGVTGFVTFTTLTAASLIFLRRTRSKYPKKWRA